MIYRTSRHMQDCIREWWVEILRKHTLGKGSGSVGGCQAN